jgi:hypothetical protein
VWHEVDYGVEAKLINLFRPAYNEVLFENYPDISNGTRSAGYTTSNLPIEQLPILFRTDYHTQEPIVDHEFD